MNNHFIKSIILFIIDRITIAENMKKACSTFIMAGLLGMTGCSTVLNNLPGVYSLDIQQGNIVNQEMVDQLRPNMTKRQVLYIMGSPMLIDVFHQKRWDYLYSEQPGGGARVQKRLSLFFDGDKLIGVQGDFRPSSLPVVAESKETTVEIPKRDLDKTMWQKISGLFSDEPDVQAGKRKTGADDEPRQDDGNEKVFDEPF